MPDTTPNLVPTEDLSVGEFKTGYWIFKHHDLLKKIVIWFLIVIIVAVWGYSAIKFIGYLATTKAHEQMLVSLTSGGTDFNPIHERNRAQDIEIVSVVVVPSGNNFDLVAMVRNPNLQWSAEKVNYSFMSGGEVKVSGENFILPLAEKYIFVSNVDLPDGVNDLTLSMNEVQWQRVKNFKDFPITDFVVSKQQFDNLNELSETSQAGSRLALDLTNNSAYSFWQVMVTVVLKSGGSVAAITSRIFDNFDSGQTQSATFFWDVNPDSITAVEVKAEVDVLDKNVFKPL